MTDKNEPTQPQDSHTRDPQVAKRRRELFVTYVVEAEMEAARQVLIGKRKPRIGYKDCAIRAGYPEQSAQSMGYYLRQQADVQDSIRDRLTAAGISDAEIIGAPALVIRHTLADCIDISEDGRSFEVNLRRAEANGAIASIRKIGYDVKGRVRIEMYNKLQAADLLASIRGLKRAEVKPNDFALRRMVIEDDIRAFREKQLLETGDEVLADERAAQYRDYLATQDAYRPYMGADDANPHDRTQETDPAS